MVRAGGKNQPDKHQPTKWRTYVRVHETIMSKLVADATFVVEHNLEYRFLPGVIEIEGEILCKGPIVIRVRKVLRVLDGQSGDNDATVQTHRYEYNGYVQGHGTFLRHDNCHPHRGHRDHHHKHVEDWRSAREMNEPIWVGRKDWPTLGAFIEEVERWYWDNYDQLPTPEQPARYNVENR